MNVRERLDAARDAVTVRRVYGDPYQEQGITIIPAASVMGGGGGGGDTEGNGGGGFGVRARPAGAWIIKNGDAQWRPAVDVTPVGLLGHVLARGALRPLRSTAKNLVTARG